MRYRLLFLTILLSNTLWGDLAEVRRLYEEKAYEEAIKAARESQDAYADARLHLLWAKSAQALGDSNAAMSAFERVLILEPDNVEAALALAKIYTQTKRYKLAASMKRKLQNYQLTPQQRSALEQLQGEMIQSVKAKASIAIGYDDNINVSPPGGSVDDYGNVAEGEVDTLFSSLHGSVSYINDFSEKNGWYVRGDAGVFIQNNFDASRFNMYEGQLSGGVGYTIDKMNLYIPVGYSRLYYLKRDLLQVIKITPTFQAPLTKKLFMSLKASYAMRRYIKSADSLRDDDSIQVEAGLFYLVGKSFLYAKAAYEDYTSKKNLHSPFVDKTFLIAKIGGNYTFKRRFNAALDYTYKNGDYKDRLPDEGVHTRSDTLHQVQGKIAATFYDSFEVYLLDRYTNNDSNYFWADYTKNVAMVGVSANY